MITGNEPASPVMHADGTHKGLTIRQWLAGQALASGTNPQSCVDRADALIEELNRTEKAAAPVGEKGKFINRIDGGKISCNHPRVLKIWLSGGMPKGINESKGEHILTLNLEISGADNFKSLMEFSLNTNSPLLPPDPLGFLIEKAEQYIQTL
jgi:hypothetical protein